MMNVVGEVKGRHCLLVDDLIDTAGTLVKGAEALLEKGAVERFGLRHARGAVRVRRSSRIEESSLKEVVVTNSIPLSEAAKKSSRIKSLSIAKLMADAIRSIHEETSVSVLFI